MAKRIFIAVIALLLVIGTIAGIKAYQIISLKRQFAHMVQETFVSDAPATVETWQPELPSVGNLTPVEGVEVSNQIAGTVTAIYFHSGETVKQGQLLVQLDDSSERAQLPGFQAQQKLAEITLRRTRELVARHLDSKSALDTAESALKTAQSNVLNTEAAIAKKALRAPFSGQLGIRNIDLGQYLAAGADIVTLQSLGSLYATFALPEQNLALLRAGQRVEVRVNAYPRKVFTGEITAIDSRVNANTHNITVQARIHNPGHLLRAGLFANVTVFAGEPQQLLSVPAAAINYSLYGDSVFVVQEEGNTRNGKPILKVQQRFVKVGEQRDHRVAITEGLKAGEIVVTAGQQKLQNGTRVEINNSVSVD